MTLKVRFFISLVVIMVLGWADAFFAGAYQSPGMRELWHQPVHLVALLLTMFIGYINWKHYPEKWLAGLWLGAYGIMIFILGITAMLYVSKITRSMSLIQPVINMRNIFTWPMPFLICYMLHLLNKHLLPPKKP